MQVLCEVVKSGPAEQIQKEAVQLFAVVGILEEATTLNNTAVRKYKTKLLSRTALRMLPAGSDVSRRKGEYNLWYIWALIAMYIVARVLNGDAAAPDAPVLTDIEVPEQVETVLEQLFGLLQDRVGHLK